MLSAVNSFFWSASILADFEHIAFHIESSEEGSHTLIKSDHILICTLYLCSQWFQWLQHDNIEPANGVLYKSSVKLDL